MTETAISIDATQSVEVQFGQEPSFTLMNEAGANYNKLGKNINFHKPNKMKPVPSNISFTAAPIIEIDENCLTEAISNSDNLVPRAEDEEVISTISNESESGDSVTSSNSDSEDSSCSSSQESSSFDAGSMFSSDSSHFDQACFSTPSPIEVIFNELFTQLSLTKRRRSDQLQLPGYEIHHLKSSNTSQQMSRNSPKEIKNQDSSRLLQQLKRDAHAVTPVSVKPMLVKPKRMLPFPSRHRSLISLSASSWLQSSVGSLEAASTFMDPVEIPSILNGGKSEPKSQPSSRRHPKTKGKDRKADTDKTMVKIASTSVPKKLDTVDEHGGIILKNDKDLANDKDAKVEQKANSDNEEYKAEADLDAFAVSEIIRKLSQVTANRKLGKKSSFSTEIKSDEFKSIMLNEVDVLFEDTTEGGGTKSNVHPEEKENRETNLESFQASLENDVPPISTSVVTEQITRDPAILKDNSLMLPALAPEVSSDWIDQVNEAITSEVDIHFKKGITQELQSHIRDEITSDLKQETSYSYEVEDDANNTIEVVDVENQDDEKQLKILFTTNGTTSLMLRTRTPNDQRRKKTGRTSKSKKRTKVRKARQTSTLNRGSDACDTVHIVVTGKKSRLASDPSPTSAVDETEIADAQLSEAVGRTEELRQLPAQKKRFPSFQLGKGLFFRSKRSLLATTRKNSAESHRTNTEPVHDTTELASSLLYPMGIAIRVETNDDKDDEEGETDQSHCLNTSGATASTTGSSVVSSIAHTTSRSPVTPNCEVKKNKKGFVWRSSSKPKTKAKVSKNYQQKEVSMYIPSPPRCIRTNNPSRIGLVSEVEDITHTISDSTASVTEKQREETKQDIAIFHPKHIFKLCRDKTIDSRSSSSIEMSKIVDLANVSTFVTTNDRYLEELDSYDECDDGTSRSSCSIRSNVTFERVAYVRGDEESLTDGDSNVLLLKMSRFELPETSSQEV